MTSNWYPPRNRQDNNLTPYVADNGDSVSCIATGGIPTQPYKRFRGLGGGTYNDFALNTPSLPSHHLIFQLPVDKPIYPRGMMLSSWTEDAGLPDRAFGALPTRFLLSASNDGQTWVPIFNQSETLTIEYLVDNKFSTINDGLDTPILDFDIYSGIADTTGVKIEDVFFKTFNKPNTSYTWFKLSFDSNSPDYRIDKQYNSTNPPTYLPVDVMRISNFAVYGDDYPPAPPFNPPTDEKQIIDYAMALNPFGSGVVQDQLIEGVNTLFALIAPDQHTAVGQFGLFQVVSVPSLNKAYVRVAKTGTNLSTNIAQDTPFKLKINYAPFNNNKDLTYTTDGLLFKNNAYDDEFYYFEIQPTFSVEGIPPTPDIGTTMSSTFYQQNPFYNILNIRGTDYESGAVAHPSVNFARTFGMITDVNNSLVADPFPRDEVYPTDAVSVVSNTSLTWGEVGGVGQQIYPIKYSSIVKQENQLVVVMDKNSTKDLGGIFLLDNYIYIAQSISPAVSNILSDVVFVDGDTGRVLIKTLTNFAIETRIVVPYNRYDISATPAELLELATIPTDPVLPSGMPTDLSYNKIVISGENQPLNINEFELFENNLNAMTNSYVKSIQDASGIYYNSLIKDGAIRQHKVVWGTDTLTPEQLAGVVADSSVNPNTITLTETGINYHKVAGQTGKFNFYSHADVSAGGSLNSVQIGTIKGWKADFTATAGAINAPFIGIYTKYKGDGSDRGSWYNSRYVLTDSAISERITSGKLYTLDDALGVATLISTSASFTDIIFLVSIGSGSTDQTEWDINIRSMDMVSDFVGGDLTIEFGHTHNLAITQNAVLHSTFNQVGMSVSFYNDNTPVFQTGLTATEGNSYNMEFSLIDENAYTGEIVADVKTEEVLPYYVGWTKPPDNYVDMVAIREEFALTSSSLWGVTFSPEDKVNYSVGIHKDKLKLFNYSRMSGSIVDNLTALGIEASYSTAEIMYIRAGLGFGLTIRQAIEYGLDKVKPLHPKVLGLMGGVKL